MARHRTTRFAFASLVAVVLAIVIPVSASAATVVVDEPGDSGFNLGATGLGSSAGLVEGPSTPALGAGSAELEVGADTMSTFTFNSTIRTTAYNLQALTDLTSLSYSTYVTQDGTGGQTPYILLNVDLDGDSGTEDFLFFEPEYQNYGVDGTPLQGDNLVGQWQTWDAYSGGWWSTSGTAGAGPGANVKSLATILADPSYASARLNGTSTGALRLVAGFGAPTWDNFKGAVDNLTVGVSGSDTTYDFERSVTGNTTEVVGANSTASTDGTADPDTNPVVTSVTTGDTGGTVTIEESNDLATGSYSGTAPVSSSYNFFGEEVQITAPAGTAANPLTLTFVLGDPDVATDKIELFRNGVLVPDCTDPELPLKVGEDPCVSSITEDMNGDVTIVAYTTAASDWGFGVENDPPETTIDSGPADGGYTQDTTPDFTYSADEDATFTCTIDAAPVACGNDTSDSGSVTLGLLTNGTHTFTVYATDTALNDDATPASSTFFIDDQAPALTMAAGQTGDIATDSVSYALDMSDPAPSSDGLTAKCNLSKSDAPAEGDATGTFVDCPGGDASGTAAADGDDGVAAYTDLEDGTYTLDVKVVDNALNESNVETRSFFVDTVDPTVTIDSGPSTPDDDPTVDIAFTADDAAPSSGIASVECELVKNDGPADGDEHGFQACTSPVAYDLTDGEYTFTVVVTDDVGRTGSDSITFRIDTVDPVLVITSGPSGPTGDNDPVFNIDVSDADPTSGIAWTRCELTGPSQSHAFQICDGGNGTAAADGDDTFQDYTNLADGSYTLTVETSDNAGNTETAARTFFVDTYAPGLLVNNFQPAGDSSLNTFSADITYSDQSPSSGIVSVECKLTNDQGPVPTDDWTDCFASITTTGASTTDTKSYTDIADGCNTFSVRVTDGAGHVTESTPHEWCVDTQDPNTVIDSGPNQPWSNDSSPTFTFHGTDPAPSSSPPYTFECKLDGGSWQSCSSPHTYGFVANGAHTFEVRAIDGAGNVDPTPASYAWSIDTVAPQVTIEFPTEGGRYSIYKDENLNSDYNCSDSGSGLGTCDGDVPDGDPIDNDTLGAHTFTVSSTDLAGNNTTKVVNYEVFTFDGLINDDDPLAYYRMNDAIGSEVMADLSGNGNDGEYKNDQDSGPEGISGDGDYARAFFGDAGYGYVNGLTAPKRYTLSAFVKFDDVGDQAVLHHGGAGAIWLEGEEFHFRPVDWWTDVELVGGPPAPDLDGLVNPDVWYHVVGTMGGGQAKLFVNAVTMDQEGISKSPSGTSTFYVGFGNLGLSRPWLRGSLDEVAYFPSNLSNQHVYEIFLADPPPLNRAKPGDSVGGGDDPAAGDAPTGNEADPPEQGDNPGGGEPRGNYETTGAEDQPGTTDDAIENTAAPMDPAGMWTRSSDKSVLEIVAKRKGWIGKTVVPAARKAKKGRKAKAAAKKRCGLKKGYKTIALSERKAGGYKGTIADPVKADGKCRTRKSPFTATLSEDGKTLTLVKRRGGKKITETLSRSVG